MTITEAAADLGISPSTLRLHVRNGKLRAEKRGPHWVVDPAEVDRFAEERRRGVSDATREKLRRWQIGRPKPPEWADRIRATMRSPEMRAYLSEAQRRVGKTPARQRQLDDLHRAKRGTHHRPESRAQMSASQIRRYTDGRRALSRLEQAAADVLLPLGFELFWRVETHGFDFAMPAHRLVVDIQGCYWHGHRLIDPSCPTVPLRGYDPTRDQANRELARRHDLTLVELWACERNRWEEIVHRYVRPAAL